MIINKSLAKTIIPYIGTTLLICGYIKLSIFYGHFGIQIYNYLEFTEILTLFMPDIIKNIGIISLAFFIVYLIMGNKEMERNSMIHDAIIESGTFWKRLKLLFKLNPPFAIISILIIIVSIVFLIWFPEKAESYILRSFMLPAMFFFYIIDFEFRRRYKLLNDVKPKSSYSNLAFIIFIFLIYTISDSYREIKKVKLFSNKIEFVYQGEKVKSSKENIYLGQTKHYLFMKNFDKEEVSIYERKNIIHLKYIKK